MHREIYPISDVCAVCSRPLVKVAANAVSYSAPSKSLSCYDWLCARNSLAKCALHVQSLVNDSLMPRTTIITTLGANCCRCILRTNG